MAGRSTIRTDMLDQPVQEQWYDNTPTLTNTIDYTFDNLGELLAAAMILELYVLIQYVGRADQAPTTAGRPMCRKCC